MRSKVSVAGACAVALSAVLTAGAADYTWQGGDGLFSDPAKWSPAGAPADGDRAKFSTAVSGTVTLTGDVANSEMQVVQTAGNTLVLDLGGNAYTLTNRFTFDGSQAGSYLVVSNGTFTVPTNTCEMKINAGVAPARLTFADGALATMDKFTSWRSDVYVLTGAVVNFNNECKIGDNAANSINTLNLNGGALNTNFRLLLPNNGGANCTSILNITAGKMTTKSYFSIGDKGWGTTWGIINLSGGELETLGELWIGNSDGGRGIINMSGGRWTARNQTFEIGHRTSAVGILNMSGGEIELATAGKYIVLGNAGGVPACSTGLVAMTSGSLIATNTGSGVLVGYASNALGRVTLGGDALIWTRSFKLASAYMSVGECVMTGGVIRSIDTVAVGDAGGGSGWMRLEDGAFTNLTSAYIGNATGSTGVLEIAGGVWSTSNTLSVANSSGSMGGVIMTGGNLSAIYANIGNSGVGTLVVSNGTVRTGLDLTAGVNGTGTVLIAGGTVTLGGILSAGKNRNSSGRIVMTDGTLTATNNIRVGDWGGVGTFDLSGGSVVSGSGGNASIGNGMGSTGRVSVTGGRLQCNLSVYAGNNSGPGTNTLGTLEVGGGAVVISNSLILGNNPYSYGEATVSGGTLWVGTDTSLGFSSNTYGRLTVTGGSFTNRNFIDCGRVGTGILHVAGGEVVTHVLRTTPYGLTNAPEQQVIVSGGRLEVTNTFYFADAVGSQARLTLSGGAFSLPKLTKSRGYTTVICDGGELEARRDEPYFIDTSLQELTLTSNGLYVDSAGFTIATSRNLPDAAGEHGKLGKRGPGKFTLNTGATFTGPVVVEAGELALGSSGLITLAGGCGINGGALLNLAARNLDFTLPSGTVSRVDGELRLASGRTLFVTNGATLGGTGSVGRVVFAPGATLARSASDGDALLHAAECVLPAGAVIALTGYAVEALRQGVAVLEGTSLDVAQGGVVAVTLDGVPQPTVALRVAGGTLTAHTYEPGTLFTVQ